VKNFASTAKNVLPSDLRRARPMARAQSKTCAIGGRAVSERESERERKEVNIDFLKHYGDARKATPNRLNLEHGVIDGAWTRCQGEGCEIELYCAGLGPAI
jgi:hypothetical protein